MNLQVVDDKGNTIGEVEKLAAHENGGVWHRAISVLLFDSSGRLLVQQRAEGKYHFAGLWANSCCSHPTVSETTERAAQRAMLNELGITAELEEVGLVRYEAYDPQSGHTEREHDHILIGRFVGDVDPNPDEVQATRWVQVDELKAEIEKQPERFAPWLPLILEVL